jgi:hypothetical protein
VPRSEDYYERGGVDIKQIALSYFENIELTNLALILFLIAFTIVVVRVMSGRNRKLYKKMERLPLEDDVYENEEENK